MALRISANGFFQKRFLEVKGQEVIFFETAAFSNKRKFGLAQIELILMSPQQVLSLQVGREVFSIQTKPGNKKHQEVIGALLAAVQPFAGTV